MYHPDDSKSVALFQSVSEGEAAQISGGFAGEILASDPLAPTSGDMGSRVSIIDPFAAPQPATNRSGGSNFNPAMILSFVQQFAQPSPYLQDPQVQAAIGSFFQSLFGGRPAS